MSKYKVKVDQDVCIGCGACNATCPAYFEMKETANGLKAKETRTDVADADVKSVKEAAETCPTGAIHVTKDEQK